jgi:hypothetical protein
MPRRSLLTPAKRAGLFAFSATDDELTQHYTFTELDISAIRQRRGNHNRLGFAVQLCYLRYPGFALPTDAVPPEPLLALVGRQLCIEPDIWPLVETSAVLDCRLSALCPSACRAGPVDWARHVLAELLVETLRQQRIILPPIDVIERVCSEALTRGTRKVYQALTASLSDQHRIALDALLIPPLFASKSLIILQLLLKLSYHIESAPYQSKAATSQWKWLIWGEWKAVDKRKERKDIQNDYSFSTFQRRPGRKQLCFDPDHMSYRLAPYAPWRNNEVLSAWE